MRGMKMSDSSGSFFNNTAEWGEWGEKELPVQDSPREKGNRGRDKVREPAKNIPIPSKADNRKKQGSTESLQRGYSPNTMQREPMCA